MKPPYEITPALLALYGEISEAVGICKSLLLVKPEARLRKENRIKTIHSSLAIEGNSLGLEHVTALINNTPVIGPAKDIREVRNAIQAYNDLDTFHSLSIQDFLKAHSVFMAGLLDSAGQFRKTQVGIVNGREVVHIAPGPSMVPGLMMDLFDYLKTDPDLPIIKSCVFHYEMEFIHPFEDGNGRLGRFWQTRLLMDVNPLFAYIPIEEGIRNSQERYYESLEIADHAGSSTAFIEFILDAINQTLRDTIQLSKAQNIDHAKRVDHALSQFTDWFDRKDYMRLNKGISSATASRDLKRLLEEGRIEAAGSGRMTKYRRK
jgi:Fic family protein